MHPGISARRRRYYYRLPRSAAQRTYGEGRGACEEDGLLERPRLGGGLLRGQHHRPQPADDVLPREQG